MFLARDFIVTLEGLVFAVTLNGIEEGRVIACLRYAPSPKGLCKVGSADAQRLLGTRYPHYLHHSPRRDVIVHAVPLECIRRHLRPRHRLAQLMADDSRDPIILRLQRLVHLLTESGIDPMRIGVTGSLLAETHTLRSDLDLVLYGRAAFHQARRAVEALTRTARLQPIPPQLWRTTWERRGCALDFPLWLWHEKRKHTKGAMESTKFDLILVEDEAEAEDTRPWRKLGPVTIRATVTDAEGAFSTPARYRLDHPEIPCALSFTATYVGQALEGEKVEIRGQMETAEDGEKRLVVGASREAPGEYIKTIHR